MRPLPRRVRVTVFLSLLPRAAGPPVDVMKPHLFLLSFLICAPLLAANTTPVTADALARDIAADNPELRFYEAELAAARAGLRSAGSRPDPGLSLEAGRKRVRDAGGALAGEGTVWSVSLAQTFEWPGRLTLRKAIANQDVALAELGFERFRSALTARARSLAYAVFAGQEKAAAAAEVAARFQALKETFLAREPGGLTPVLETRVIEAQELTLRRRATDAALAIAAARTELNQLRGAPLDDAIEVARPALAFREPPTLESLLGAAREHNFDFRAKRLELEQQGFAVQLARHERRPAFTVAPFVESERAGDRETTVGLGLSVPLPVSSRHRAESDRAEARRRQAEAALQLAGRQLERELAAAAQAFVAKREEIAAWAPDSVAKFREAAALADRHYRLGAVPLGTYVELQTAYLDAVDALLDTEHEAFEAALTLQQLTGVELRLPEATP